MPGRITFDGRDLGALDDDAATLLRRRQMGFVFQAFHVLPYLTVAQNAALPLQLLGVRLATNSARVAEMLVRRARAFAARCRASCRAARCSASRSRARWCIGRAAARRRADRQPRSADRDGRCSRCCASRCGNAGRAC
jgi:ABC-type ATPase involved in cell division